MKRSLLLTLLACAGLHATTLSLATNPQDTGSGNTSFSFTNGGVTVTVSSYSTFNGGSALSAASIQQFGTGLGLGVCNSAELARNTCTFDDWQLSTFVESASGGPADGSYRDFMLFTFDQGVTVQTLTQLQSSQTSYDNDFQWWYSTTAVSNPTNFSGFTLGGTYNGSGMVDSTFGSPYATNVVSLNTLGLRSLLIGVGQSSTDTSDRFKLNALSVTGGITINSVPEPASMALMGSGLLGLGLLARRRRK